jgi:uncharacterized protein (DUF924 family)
MTVNLVEQIMDYWFAGMDKQGRVPAKQQACWWRKDPQQDAWLTSHFSQPLTEVAQEVVQEMAQEELVRKRHRQWVESPLGYLALVILTDQFSRQIYRGQAQAYAYDGLALDWALQAIEQGWDQQVLPIQRVFFYMPLEHTEDLRRQDQCVALFTKLADEVPEDQRQTFQGFTDFAIRHQQVIARFGRFPHRNQILGRISTAEERIFLQ